MSEEALLNTQEAIQRLGISRKTLYQLMDRGLIHPVNAEIKPYLRRRQPLKFRERDVERLLEGDSAGDEDKPANRVA